MDLTFWNFSSCFSPFKCSSRKDEGECDYLCKFIYGVITKTFLEVH